MIGDFFVFLLMYMNVWHANADTRPNIIFILADDMGINDVSYHGSPQIPTPNIDALAASGIIITRYYAAPQCTPSRASLMTGKFPSNTGLQHFVISSAEPTGLPLEMITMPQHLKKLGYSTHMIGKWHLGYYKKEYTPTYRGFDTFFGYWNGEIDYYDYTNYEATDIPGISAMWGRDLHENLKPAQDCRGNFSMEVFTKKAVEVIQKHSKSNPLFLYFSSQACHTGNRYQPIQAPPERVARFTHIEDLDRRTYAGLVSSLDDAIAEIVSTLHSKGMLENSIIAFAGDNGGEVVGEHGGQASNWPLRGMKFYLWEGGVRVPAVLWSPLLKLKQPRTYEHMMHVSDWLPTLYRAAGGSPEELGDIDGKDMWDTLKDNLRSPRKEIILNLDPFFGMSALIRGRYKLVNGTYLEGKDRWFGPSGQGDINVRSMDAWVWRNGSVVKNILQQSGKWLLKTPDTWRKKAKLHCGKYNQTPQATGGCYPSKAPCLFDIESDPCEYHNIAGKHSKIVKSMLKRIKWYNMTGYDSISTSMDPRGDPRCHGFQYEPWLDEEYASDCPWLD